jgi:hypothetical protein
MPFVAFDFRLTYDTEALNLSSVSAVAILLINLMFSKISHVGHIQYAFLFEASRGSSLESVADFPQFVEQSTFSTKVAQLFAPLLPQHYLLQSPHLSFTPLTHIASKPLRRHSKTQTHSGTSYDHSLQSFPPKTYKMGIA